MYYIGLVPLMILLLVCQWVMVGEEQEDEEEAMRCVEVVGLARLQVKLPPLQCVGGCHLAPPLQVLVPILLKSDNSVIFVCCIKEVGSL